MNGLPEHDFAVQTELIRLAGSLAVGLPAGLLLDIFRTLRALLPHHAVSVFLEDFVYAVLFALMTELYAGGFCGGVLRWYQIAGALLGLGIYLLTIGAVTGRLLRRLRHVQAALRRAGETVRSGIRDKIRSLFVRNPENDNSGGNLQESP